MANTAIGRPEPGVELLVTRRAFLGAGLGVGGALLVGFQVPAAGAAAEGKGVFALTPSFASTGRARSP